MEVIKKGAHFALVIHDGLTWFYAAGEEHLDRKINVASNGNVTGKAWTESQCASMRKDRPKRAEAEIAAKQAMYAWELHFTSCPLLAAAIDAVTDGNARCNGWDSDSVKRPSINPFPVGRMSSAFCLGKLDSELARKIGAELTEREKVRPKPYRAKASTKRAPSTGKRSQAKTEKV